jgi:hypothetical protein
LKRKVANLPPVTQEWFEEHKNQLQATYGRPEQQVWIDPLTKKKFRSEHTYDAFVTSNKYKALVKKTGLPAPAPIVHQKASETDGAVHFLTEVSASLFVRVALQFSSLYV